MTAMERVGKSNGNVGWSLPGKMVEDAEKEKDRLGQIGINWDAEFLTAKEEVQKWLSDAKTSIEKFEEDLFAVTEKSGDMREVSEEFQDQVTDAAAEVEEALQEVLEQRTEHYGGHRSAGPKIRNTNIIDIACSYVRLVLGCIDADLCK